MFKNINKIAFFLLFIVALSSITLLDSCKKEVIVVQQDPCANIKCLNGGSCANGSCNCPSGWSGSDCSKQVTPSKILITKVDLLKFPATTSTGAGWDPLDAPDVILKLTKGTATIWDSPTIAQNAVQNTTYIFTPTTPIEITAPLEKYNMEVWDYDTLDPNDYMGGITFTPYSSTGGFPSTITLECTGCTTSFKLYVQYIF